MVHPFTNVEGENGRSSHYIVSCIDKGGTGFLTFESNNLKLCIFRYQLRTSNGEHFFRMIWWVTYELFGTQMNKCITSQMTFHQP